MLLVVRGDYVHTWTYFGSAKPLDNIQCQGKTLRLTQNLHTHPLCGYELAKGRYFISKVWVPQYNSDWFVVDGFQIGASCGSVLQWTGMAWGINELRVYDNGTLLLNPPEDEAWFNVSNYTLDAQEERIRSGIITNQAVIARHTKYKKKYDDMPILRGIRQMIKNHQLNQFVKSFIRLADLDYRLDLRHRLADGNTGQMFAGIRIGNGNLLVDHCRMKSGIVDYKSFDPMWPTFDLADPECFDKLLNYLLECRMTGSDQKLWRYIRRRHNHITKETHVPK